MSDAVFRYVFYRVVSNQGRVRMGLSKLPVSDYSTAHPVVERREQAVVLQLYVLPALVLPLLDGFAIFLRRSIPISLLAEFLHSLGLMLHSGLPVDIALKDLRDDARHPALKALTTDLLSGVRGGNTLSSRLSLYPHLVPATVRHLVDIGEHSGNLDRVLIDASEHLGRITALRRDVSRALIYPFFVVATVIIAALFWVYYVLPDLADMFRQMGAHLPPLTQNVMNAVHWMRELLASYGYWVLALMLLMPVLLSRSQRVKAGFYWLAYHLPISRRLVRTSSMAFISEYLALLVAAGINLLDGLAILEAATRNEVYRRAIRQTRQGVMRGNTLASGLERSGVFSPLMIRLINVGEQSGNLDGQLRTLADEYRRRLNHLVATLAEVIKPAVLLLAGALFVFVVVVFLLPVYDLIAQSTQLR